MTILKSKLDVLIAARQLISDEERWTQKEYARDKDGYCINADHEKATCWCSVGALDKVSRKQTIPALVELNMTVGRMMSAYNDTHSHAEVLAVWDETIRRVAAEAVTN